MRHQHAPYWLRQAHRDECRERVGEAIGRVLGQWRDEGAIAGGTS